MKNNSINNNNFKQFLKDEAAKRAINLDDNIVEKFEIYKDLLLEWNEKINLTAIIDPYEIALKHFVDCLECVKYIKENTNIIDIGTGAGFPGIVIAIYFDGNVKITLLDALNKRLLFLQEVVNKLNLNNVQVIHGRAEDIASKYEYREQFDIVTSRAVANLPVLLEYTTPFLKVNGYTLIMKGANYNEELENAKNAFDVLNLKLDQCIEYKYELENETFHRYILKISKYKNTPKKYPRNYGKIKKQPL